MNRTGSVMVQGQLWGRAAHDWVELQEPMALPLWEAMLDAAMVGPGAHVLDDSSERSNSPLWCARPSRPSAPA
jgi:hypothetical protein